jgi:leucyl-tRNA synthetase
LTKYPYRDIESKWQRRWEEIGAYHASDDREKPKSYVLVEFPYPSGAGLHVGHPRSYTAMDIIARKRRMEGYNVLFPIGYDAFGLPAETYAIETGTHPRITTERNIANYRRQLKMLGLSFDWSREINTTDPSYYKWTQWMFLRMFRAGLAYKAEVPINWCPALGTALANEEVINGRSERGGHPVVRLSKSQWMLRITKYADRLLESLNTVDYIKPVVEQQTNWIGRSYGAEIFFPIADTTDHVEVFTTRPDTIFGATYLVLAPEHPIIVKYRDRIENFPEADAYRADAEAKSDFERTELVKEKTGVCLKGLTAINPATQQAIPIWVSGYVLMSYGSGAIMGVPGHDARDWEFARRFRLPIIEVVKGGNVLKEAYVECDQGTLVNSAFLNGLSVTEATPRIIDWLEARGLGRRKVQYKLLNWVFSRQRYWGEPIPLIHCPKCGWVEVPESQLPVLLPEVVDFRPGPTVESPLARIKEWVEVACPRCQGPARRETDTMPQWAGSCWYFLRYVDPNNDERFAAREALDYWLPVDWYNGGMEHTTLHLLYSRFWCNFLYDEGLLPCAEPFKRRTSHGMVLGADNEKMSKSRGNVINPDDVVGRYGADTFRLFEMYMGAFAQVTAWSDEGVNGCHRFLSRVWSFQERVAPGLGLDEATTHLRHRMVRDVNERIERMKFNTALAALMECSNEMSRIPRIPEELYRTFLILLHPFAPHVTAELWELLDGTEVPLQHVAWPFFAPELAQGKMLTIAIQVNGKLRDTMEVDEGIAEEELIALALKRPKIVTHLAGNAARRKIYIPHRLVNFLT